MWSVCQSVMRLRAGLGDYFWKLREVKEKGHQCLDLISLTCNDKPEFKDQILRLVWLQMTKNQLKYVWKKRKKKDLLFQITENCMGNSFGHGWVQMLKQHCQESICLRSLALLSSLWTSLPGKSWSWWQRWLPAAPTISPLVWPLKQKEQVCFPWVLATALGLSLMGSAFMMGLC